MEGTKQKTHVLRLFPIVDVKSVQKAREHPVSLPTLQQAFGVLFLLKIILIVEDISFKDDCVFCLVQGNLGHKYSSLIIFEGTLPPLLLGPSILSVSLESSPQCAALLL